MTDAEFVADLLNLCDQDLLDVELSDTDCRVGLSANGRAFIIASCDHQFLDSVSCVKCGWTPTAVQLVTGASPR
jgi:N-acetylmuramic acid 6-phosphate (MurNAc-6-P) etherase